MSSIALVACGDGAATSILGLSTVLSSDSETVDFPEHSSEVIYASDANANDSQGLGVVYALSGGADISKFGLSTITGNIWFTEAQDFENPSDVDQNNIYEVEISAYEVAVSDDLTEDSIWSVTLAVNVTNVNEAPAFTSSSVASVVENSANAIYTATVDDIDIGDNHTFTVVGGDDRSWFSFAEASLSLTGANLSFTAPPDYESASDADGDNAYEVVIRVTDTGGLSADLSLTVNVTDVNEAPKITSAVSDLLLFENISGVIYEVLATDDENDTLSYQLSGSDSPAFSISGSAVSFSPSPDYEFPSDTNSDNVYSINIEVSDGNSVTIQALDVTVADRNDNTPVIRASQNFVVKENSASGLIFGVVEATDADASATTYQDWKIISGNSNSAFSIDPSSGELSVAASSALDHESDYVSYDLILTVSDGANTSASTTVSVYVDDVNEVPVIAANQIFAIDENTPDDTGFGLVEAEDADAGDILQDWAIESGNTNGAFALNASTGVLSVANSSELDYESTTGYFLTITVSDGNLTSAAKTVTININDVNDNTPFITAGQSLSIEENSANNTSLGTVTYSDADSAAVNSFVWGIIEGNTNDVFAIDNSGGITVATSSELDYETLTSYTLKLQVSDGVNTSNAESLTIDIKDLNDNRPEIEAGKTFQIDEDSADNTYVGAVNATDADSASVNTFTWSITSGNDGDIFAIETASADASGIYASSGDIIVANSSVFDYESISSYKLTIIVSDGNSTSFAQTFRVNLENVNEAPYFTSASTATISENNVSFIYIAAADDYDAGDSASLSYSLVGGADKALFDLNGDQLTFKNAPDYETLPASGDNTYEVELEVTDTGGLSDKLNLSISVVDVNDNAPVITAKQTFTIDENSDNDISLGTVDFNDSDTNAVNTFAWQITGGNTNDAFHIDSEDGELSVATSSELDHESTPSYTIKLIVNDGQQASAETNITINVNDVNEAPVINSVSATEVSVAENINYETYIVYRATATSSGDTPLATDPEGDTLSYSLSGEDNASFAIDPSDGIIKFQAAPDYDEPSDANKNNEYEIIIEVSDSIHIAEHALTVKLTDVDEPPVINNSTFSISVNENIATKATIYEVNASDPEKQTLIYSLDTNSDDDEHFSISDNGQIRFANVPNYENPGDANADNTYQVTIQVSDGGLSTSQQLTIAVTNVNEAPTADAGVDMEVNEGVQVTLSASYEDPDEEGSNHKETIAYSWQEVDSNNNPLATVDLSNADIATPSFASPSNISADTNITFQLTVTDDAGNGYSATDTIVITVNNSPTVDAGANQRVTEGEQVTLTGSASDTNEGSIESYSWAEVDSSGAEVISSSVIDLSVTDTATISFTAPQVVAGEDNEGIITLTFQLTVTDNDGAQEQSVVEVAVENLPVIQSVYLDDDDSAYGIGDTATVYIQAANSETDLKLKEGTFNGGTLSNFAEDGGGNDGLYSASYLVESAHSSVTAGGTVTTNIVLEDAYGHESTSYTPVTLDGDEYIDTVPPSQTISTIEINHDTGISDTDFITNIAAQTITAELNDSLEDSDILYGSVASDESGPIWVDITNTSLSDTSISWSTTLSSGADPLIQFKVVDAAGNDGQVATQAYTLDTKTPSQAVTLSSIKLSADTGTADDDFITNTAEQTISAELNASLGSGDVLYASVDDGTSWAKIYTESNLSNQTSFSWNTSLPAEGTSSIQFQVADSADNNGSLTEQNYTLDQTAPALAVTISSIKLSADTGTADDDFITNTAAQTISAELNATLGTGDVLYASVDDGENWAKIYDDSNLSGITKFSWATNLPAEGTSSIQFQVTDLADNNGSLTEQSYTLDQTVPALAVTLSSIKLSADTGTADDDFITNTAAQIISAELNATLGTGDVLYASVDDGASWAKIYTDSNLSNQTSFSWNTSLPAEGNSSIQFQVADLADNNGSLTEQSYTLDQTAASQAVTLSSIKLSTDTGSSNTDFITNTAEQTISAELNASLGSGDVLYASVNDGTSWAKIYTESNLSDSTSFSWTTSLLEGNSAIQFQVADSSDNNGSLTEQNYTLDQTAPALAVTLSSIKLSTDTGTADDDFITNAAEQTISAELNASLSSGDVLYASVDSGGTWQTIDSASISGTSITWATTLVESTNSIQFQVADFADNNGSLTEQNYTLDQTAPALAVTLSSIKLSADTGTADDDFITNTAAQIISAELNATLGTGDVLYASVDDGANWAKIYTGTNLSSISFSWDTTLLEGTSSIQFQVADLADNNGSLTEQNYTLDQTAPALAVTLSSIKLSADTGTTDDDFITNTAAQTISAELNASLGTGDVLYASVDDGANWAKIYTGTNLSSISFSWDTTLLEGTSSIQFQVADSADNNGSLTEQSYTLDITAPALAVTLSSIKLSTDTGTADDDFITNTAAQTISAELNASLSSGDVLYASVDSGGTWQTIDSASISGTSIAWATTLVESTNSIQFQVADSADNNGSLTEQSYTLDITAPALAVTLSSIKLSADTGTADDDFITNTAAQTISAELNATLGIGDVLYASVDSGGTWQTIDNASISGTSITWATTLVESTNSIQFQVADSADNNGSLTEQSYTLDITAPALAVTLSSIKLSADTGSSNTDFITNTAAQTISAELNASLGSGDVIYASLDSGGTWQTINSGNISGTSITWASTLVEGTSSIQFQVADSADNNGSLTEQNYTLDQTAPALAVTLSSIKLSADTGTADDDFITNTAAQTISAELNASLGSGDVLYASVDDGANWAKIYTESNLSGSTRFSWTTSLLEGNNAIQFQVADSADNNGSLTEQSYTLDITAPSQAVTLSSIKLSADTGSSNTDFITNTAAQTISAELNASLGSGDVLYASVDDGTSWAKIYTGTNLSSISFSWDTTLLEGNSSIQFQVADSADNNGSLTKQNYTLDNTAPALAVALSSIKLSADTGTADDDFITNTAEQTISAELNATLGSGDVLYASVDDGANWAKIYTDSNLSNQTSFSWNTSLPAEGTSSIQFQVADSADNNGSLTEQSYTLDQTAPALAVTLSSIKLSADTGTADDDFITNIAEQTISAELNTTLGTGDVLYASVDDGANWAKIYTDSNLSNQTSFSWNTSLPAEGTSSIQFQVADSADNNGSLTEQSYTLDQTAPALAVTLSSIKLSADTGTADDDFITNIAVQTISAELNASLGSGDVLYASVDDGANWAKIYIDGNLSITSFAWTTSLPTEGTSSIQFQVADSADNNGSLTEQNYTLDITAPALAVKLSSIKLSADTGTADDDFITNTAAQTISAELNAILGSDDVLYASVDDGANWAKIYTESNLSGSTSFSWTTSLLEGSSAIQFQVADSVDNNGSLTEQNYTLDQTAPSQAVTLSSIKLSTDTGSSNTDFITNTAAQTISAELNATLGIGDVLYASVDDGASWAKIYTESNLSTTSFSWSTTLPAEDNSSIQFQVADSADNNGSLTEQNYTLDQTAPVLAVTLSSIKLSADTGTADDDFITNIAAQTISAELNASLGTGDVLYASVDDGTSWSKIYTDANLSGSTSFSWTTSLPTEGNSSIQFQVADSADNNGSLTEQNYTLDQTAPALAVTLSSIKLSADTGTADDDFITNTAAQTISAELNATLGIGDVLYASVDDGENWAKIYTDSNLSNQTSFSWNTSLPAESNSSIQFQVADSADNNGSLTEQNYTLDQTAPALAVTLSSIKLSADTGTADDDFITNTAAQTISAELNATLGIGDVLYASVDDGANWAKIYNDGNLSSISFSWDTSLLEGTSSIQFQVADSADNNGSLTEQNYTLDQTAPALAVTLGNIKLSADTGTADDDFITNTAEQTISAELNATLGSSDVLYASVDDGANWAKIYTGTNLSSISFSWDTTLLEGTSSIQFQVADSADNNGSLTEQNYTLDQTAPALAVTLSSIKLSADTGTADDDFITNTAAQTISAELNASLSSGDVLYASVDSGGTWQTIDSASISGTSIAWATTLVESTNSIQFQVADSADNNGSLTEQNYTLDITAPALAVTLGSIKLSTDTGTADDDFITNTAAQTISAELNATLGIGDVLYASVDDGANWAKIYNDGNLSSISFSWDTSLLEGNSSIQFQVADSADNNGSLTEQNYTLDQTAPALAVTLSSIKLSADTGSSNTDFITNTAEQTISAELNYILDTGDVLYASVDDGENWAKIYTDSNLSNQTSFSWNTSLPAEGTSSIQFQVADSADNNGSLTEQNYTLDQTAPSLAVTLGNIKLSADTGTADDDFITNTAAQTISAELNASLGSGDVLYASVNDGTSWAKIYTDSNLSGITKFSWTTSLPAEGNSSIQFQVADSADNNASLTEQNYTLDTIAPSIAITSVATDGTINASEVSAVVIDGAASENGQSVALAVTDGTTTVEATPTVADGIYSATVDLSSLTESASISLTATILDTAGNDATAIQGSIIKDTIAPSISSIFVAGDNYVNSKELSSPVVVSGSTTGVEDNQPITININGQDFITYVSANTFTTDANLSSLSDGTYDINASVADASGNPATEFTGSFVIETVLPTQAVKPDSISLSHDTSSSTSYFLTNQAAQTISAELNASLGADEALYASVDSGSTWLRIYDDENLTNPTSFDWVTTLQTGTNSIYFRVTDTADNNGTDTTQLYTLDTNAPGFTSSATASIAENTSGTIYTAEATDTETSNLTLALSYSLSGTDAAELSIDSASGAISFASPPDFETPTDASTDNTYEVTLEATDPAGNSTTQALTITVTDVNDVAPVIDSNQSLAISETGAVGSTVGTVSVTDADTVNAFTWSITDTDNGSATTAANPGAYFAIDPSTGQITVTKVLTDNAAGASGYDVSLNIQVNDGATDSAVAEVTITVQAAILPDDFDIAGIGAYLIKLTWSEVDASDIYYIYRSSDSACNLASYNSCADGLLSSSVTPPFTDIVPESGITYYYWLHAERSNSTLTQTSATPISATPEPRLNDTGINWGGDYSSGNNSDCSSNIGATQDCDHGLDAGTNAADDADGHAGFSYIKLDSAGNALSASATEWSCVRDNVTGLIWEVKTDDDSLHDKDDTYNWYNTDSETNGGSVGYADDDGDICHGYDSADSATFCNTEAFVARVNSAGLCGAHDWRLPNAAESHSLTIHDTNADNIDTAYFPNTETSGNYWSDSPADTYTADKAWQAVFRGGGSLSYTEKGVENHARLVRGDEYIANDWSDKRYIVHNDGTVTDTNTSLMWMQCSLGQYHNYDGSGGNSCTDNATSTYTWETALEAAEASAFANYTDWRIPNIRELFSLTALDNSNYLNSNIFPIVSTSANKYNYWTSSPSGTNNVFLLKYPEKYLGFGQFARSNNQPNLIIYVRLVRSTD